MRCQRRGREGMVQSKAVTTGAPLLLRVPGVLRHSWIVVPPHIGPAERRQSAEVLRAYKRLAGFGYPVGAGIPIADE